MDSHLGVLRLSEDRCGSGRQDRDGGRDFHAHPDLGRKAGNRQSGSPARRSRDRLRIRAGQSNRRQSGPLARTSGPSPAEAKKGARGRASPGVASRADCGLHDCPRRAGRCCRASAGLHDPDGSAVWRDPRYDVGRSRSTRRGLDHPSGANEGGEGTPRAVDRCRLGPARKARRNCARRCADLRKRDQTWKADPT